MASSYAATLAHVLPSPETAHAFAAKAPRTGDPLVGDSGKKANELRPSLSPKKS